MQQRSMWTRARCARRALASLVVVGCLVAAAPAVAVEAGDRAPAFSAPALGRPGVVSLGDHRGKIVYVDFWASWCGPCLVSLPQLDQLRREFDADHFQVLAVNLDKEPAKAMRFLEKLKVGYPSASDPQGRVPESYGLTTMPTSYLIDRDGVVRYVHKGFREGDLDEIRTKVAELLGRSVDHASKGGAR